MIEKIIAVVVGIILVIICITVLSCVFIAARTGKRR